MWRSLSFSVLASLFLRFLGLSLMAYIFFDFFFYCELPQPFHSENVYFKLFIFHSTFNIAFVIVIDSFFCFDHLFLNSMNYLVAIHSHGCFYFMLFSLIFLCCLFLCSLTEFVFFWVSNIYLIRDFVDFFLNVGQTFFYVVLAFFAVLLDFVLHILLSL